MKKITIALVLYSILNMMLVFLIFYRVYEVKTLRQVISIQQEKIIGLKKDLLSCGEAVRQCNVLPDNRTLILKLTLDD